MNEEQINVKIAELCGWTMYPGHSATCYPDQWRHESGEFKPRTAPPDYCTDLNAMHQAEGTMSLEQWDSYITELYRIAQLPHICHFTHEIAFIHATAKQRAIAFLKTKGIEV
jgi:hypothetical protein